MVLGGEGRIIMKLDKFTFLTPNGLVSGLWACKRTRGAKYPQVYPQDFLKRVYNLLEIDEKKHRVCHLFSGTIEGEYTVDLNPNTPAKFKEDATKTHFSDNFFDLVLADPPYDDERAKLFGFKKAPKIKDILKEARRITKPNGYYGILHFVVPSDYFKERIAVIGVTEGANMRIRAFTLFKKV